jgi:hypothetical protein
VICPSCRGAKARETTLRDLRKEAHCDACNITYTADFADSVEVTFQPNPAIRKLDVAYYCSGGPMNAPHVVAQQGVKPGESRTISLRLNPWHYRIRSLKSAGDCLLKIQPGGEAQDVSVVFGSTGVSPGEITAGPEVRLTL